MTQEKNDQTDNEQPFLTRQDFEERFRRYRDARRGAIVEVTVDQMDVFYAIAEEFVRDSRNLPGPGEDRKSQVDDAKNSKARMKGMKDRLDEVGRLLSPPIAPEQATTILPQSTRKELTAFRRDLEEEFEFEGRRLEAVKSRASTKLARHAELEFTLDLLRFVRDSFPNLTDRKRRGLVEAAMAGAGCFTKSEIMARTQPTGLRMKFKRAEEYKNKMYPDGRFYPHLGLLRKKKQEVGKRDGKSE